MGHVHGILRIPGRHLVAADEAGPSGPAFISSKQKETDMRNFVRNLVAAVGLALSILAVAFLSVPVAYAQPVPLGQRSFSPRMFQTQQRHYLRFSVNFNTCVYVSLACPVKVGTLPYTAFLPQRSFQ